MSVPQPAAISQEEFQRLQTQLLDLRSANYTLMEESNRYKNGEFPYDKLRQNFSLLQSVPRSEKLTNET